MNRILFRGGTIVDPVLGQIESDLVVDDGRIVDVGTALDLSLIHI